MWVRESERETSTFRYDDDDDGLAEKTPKKENWPGVTWISGECCFGGMLPPCSD